MYEKHTLIIPILQVRTLKLEDASDLLKVTQLWVAMLDLNSGCLMPQTNTYLILEAGGRPLHLIGEKPHGCSYIVFVFHNVYTLSHFGKDKCTLQLVIETADFSKNLLLQSFVYHYGLPTYHELPQLQSSLDNV